MNRNIFFYVLLVVIILVFLFTYGFKLLIGFSLVITGVSNRISNQNTDTKQDTKEEFFGRLVIDSVPTATNSAKIIVEGTVSNFDYVDVYINKKKEDSFTLPGSDSFRETTGPLIPGENTLYFIARTKKTTDISKTKEYTVIYKNEKPKLEISQPNNDSTVSSPETIVKGVTDKEVFIRINNSPVVVDVAGNFQYAVNLSEGDNKIEIIAEDIAGNTETKTLTVKYKKE